MMKGIQMTNVGKNILWVENLNFDRSNLHQFKVELLLVLGNLLYFTIVLVIHKN